MPKASFLSSIFHLLFSEVLFIKKYFFSSTFILLLALVLRLWGLHWKPAHFDEGINGWFVDQIRIKGFYAYDPTNYHGPLYFYLLFIFQTLFGRNLWALRLPAAMSSLGTVWLALRFDRFLGKEAARFTALTLALSPAAVFYGRYSIHESSVVFSLMIFLFGLFGLWKVGDRRSLWITVTGGTLMLLLKETAIIHFGCFILAALFLRFWEKNIFCSIVPQQWNRHDFMTAFLFAIVVLLFFYSGTFLNGKGLLHIFETIPAWVHTGTGAGGHEKTEYQLFGFNFYWMALMLRYEWPSLLGFIYACGLLFKKSSSLLRYLSIYALGVLVAYSLIPYKTPWCMISIIWPFALLFGAGTYDAIFAHFLDDRACSYWRLMVLLSLRLSEGSARSSALSEAKIPAPYSLAHSRRWNEIKSRSLSSWLAGTALMVSFFFCLRLNFWRYVDFSEPYVYVQTSPEIERVTTPLLSLAKQDPRYLQLRGQIFLESYYPLPWILGDFTNIGYYTPSHLPQQWDGDFILVEASVAPEVERQLQESYYQIPFQLRDAMEPCVVFFKKKIFESYFLHPQTSLFLKGRITF